MNPLEYCNRCFDEKKPDIVQIRKDQFVLPEKLPIQQYTQLCKVVVGLGGKMNSAYKNPGFKVPLDKIGDAAYLISQIGLDLHRQNEHLANVFAGFPTEEVATGQYRFVSLPEDGGWQFLDPQTRLWVSVTSMQSDTGMGANMREHTAVRHTQSGKTMYYYLGGKGKELHEVEKRAAFNLAARRFSRRNAFWTEHENLGFGVIHLSSLRMVPNDIFFGLVSLRPYEYVMDGYLYFDIKDFELVKQFLKAIKIDLFRCLELVILPGDTGKGSGSPVIPIADITPAVVSSFCSFISSIGGTTTKESGAIKVKNNQDSYTVRFVDRRNAIPVFSDNILYIPLSLVENVKEFLSVAASLAKRAKKNVHLWKNLAECWTVSNETDMSFLLDCIAENLEDDEFITRLLSNQQKQEQVRKWYDESVKGADANDMLNAPLDLLRSLSKHLDRQNGEKN